MNSNKKENLILELYKIFNTKVNEESRGLFIINSAFLIVSGGLLAFIGKEESILNLLIASIGISVAIFWRSAINGQSKFGRRTSN